MGLISLAVKGKVFFITGATGFVAKGLVEKLLRDTPDVKRIYLLIRPGRKGSAEQRLDREIISSNAFSRLRGRLGPDFDPAIRPKLVAVPGDLSQTRMGLSPELYSGLREEVDIVVNCAASVVFDERLDRALELNTLGARRILEFAKACRDAIFVHVSTAYVNGRQTGHIPERLLSPEQIIRRTTGNGHALDFDLDSEIESIRKFRNDVIADAKQPSLKARFHRTLERQNRGKRVTAYRRTHQLDALRERWITQKLVKEGMSRARELGWNDTYTFTKAMGEQIIARHRGSLPTAIVRPSIIESSLCDPEPGWLDGLKVADPLFVHYGKGRLAHFPANPDIVLDIVPVDIVTNAIIAILPQVRRREEMRVYQVATSSVNPLKLGDLAHWVYEYFSKRPMQDRDGKPIHVQKWRFPTPDAFQRQARFRYQLPLAVLLWLADHVPVLPTRMKRKISVFEATFRRLLSLSEIYGPYATLDCRFETENIRRLHRALDPEDRSLFGFDVSNIEWQAYVQEIHLPGLKRHVLKENPVKRPTGQRG